MILQCIALWPDHDVGQQIRFHFTGGQLIAVLVLKRLPPRTESIYAASRQEFNFFATVCYLDKKKNPALTMGIAQSVHTCSAFKIVTTYI